MSGLCGEIAGYAWDPHGAGSSVALCGLIGGLLVALWRRGGHGARLAFYCSLYMLIGLVGVALDGIALAIALCVAASVILRLVSKSLPTPELPPKLGPLAMLAAALLLTVRADIHGPPVLAGALLAVLMVPAGKYSANP